MKFQVAIVTALVAVSNVSAFTTPSPKEPTQKVVEKTTQWWAPISAAAVIGLSTLASPTMVEAQTLDQLQNQQQEQVITAQPFSSSIYLSEGSTMSMDFSLPSYDPTSKSSGFQQSDEEGLNIGVGRREQDLQKEAIAKAEAARKERLAKKNEERKAMEAENKRREEEKKARMGERMATLWN